MNKTALILLSGGVGSRMQAPLPKQYLPLGGKTIAERSLEPFLLLPEIGEIVVVCEAEYENYFNNLPVQFAMPGARRQDSLLNGLLALQKLPDLVCIHDAARPFVTEELVRAVLKAGREHGAAASALPLKFTVKVADENRFVSSTPDRSRLYEVQTPQAVSLPLLQAGFEKVQKENLTVTDDVALAEILGKPVKLVDGSPFNLKITSPEDLLVAEQFLQTV